MKRKLETFGKWLSLAALVLFVGLAVTACKPNAEEEASIYGTWTSSWDEVFNITETTFDNGEDSYAGNELVCVPLTKDSGMLYFKYTKAGDTQYTDPEDDAYTKYTYWMNSDYNIAYIDPEDPDYTKYEYWYGYTEDAPDVGKWYAVYYFDLTAKSVNISGAFGDVSSTETLEEAKATFTVENGYFAGKSECVKTK